MSSKGHGIYSLEALRQRCYISSTGCWEWRQGFGSRGARPLASIPPGVLGNDKRVLMDASRAAWLLSGKEIPQGKYVIRNADCKCRTCINPAHRHLGGRGDQNRASAERGTYNTPHRMAMLHAARLNQAVPSEVVREVEAFLLDGATQQAAVEKFGLNIDTIRRIQRGDHIRQRHGAMPGSSIFNFGAL